MKDLPFFTTQYGVASLALKQIPFNGSAYVTIQDSAEPMNLLDECCDFFKALGAKTVYASGHDCLDVYPLYTSVVLMRCLRTQLPDTDAALFPVQQKTLERFREIYNLHMQNVPIATYMSAFDADKMLEGGRGYFIHRGNDVLGIGIAGGSRIDAVVSLKSGGGKEVVLALNHALSGECAEVEVASTNHRAIRLYDKLGFVLCGEKSRWYKIF